MAGGGAVEELLEQAVGLGLEVVTELAGQLDQPVRGRVEAG